MVPKRKGPNVQPSTGYHRPGCLGERVSETATDLDTGSASPDNDHAQIKSDVMKGISQHRFRVLPGNK
jgi:hypothetical protein